MTIIASNERRWYPAYSVLGLYVLLCGLFVFLAPNSYEPHLPFSRSLAAVSALPSTVAFSVEAMWVTFPLALFAFSMFAPVKLKNGSGQTAIPITVVGFILFSCAAIFVLGYGMLGQADVTSSTKVAHMTGLAARSKYGLFYALSIYFCISLVTTWFAFVACPRAYFILRGNKV